MNIYVCNHLITFSDFFLFLKSEKGIVCVIEIFRDEVLGKSMKMESIFELVITVFDNTKFFSMLKFEPFFLKLSLNFFRGFKSLIIKKNDNNESNVHKIVILHEK